MSVSVSPGSYTMVPGQSWDLSATGTYEDCNLSYYSYDLSDIANWSSSNTSVMTMGGNYASQCNAIAASSATATAGYSDYDYACIIYPDCNSRLVSKSGYSSISVQAQIQISAVSASPTTIHTTNTPNTATISVQVYHQPVAAQQTVVVNVGTYSSNPPGINGSYSPTNQTVTIPAGSPQGTVTVTSSVSVGSIGTNTTATVTNSASLSNASSGLTILAPSPASNARATMTIDNP